MSTELKYAGDFELWARFFQHAELSVVSTPLAVFRKQPNQVSDRLFAEYMAECVATLAPYYRSAPNRVEAKLRRAFRNLPRGILRRLPKGIVYPYTVLAMAQKSDRSYGWQQTTRWMI